MAQHKRQQSWQHVRRTTFDVTILGGGINGACLYHRLCTAGYKVLLVDQGDFAAGTSQASGMMIWGGLLYLRSLDLLSVYRFSQARDAMIRNLPEWIEPAPVHYIPAHQGPPDPRLVLGG
ncbi:MAG: FAD-dependent oxidoreductase, partial [Pseudomonadota bacterium]